MSIRKYALIAGLALTAFAAPALALTATEYNITYENAALYDANTYAGLSTTKTDDLVRYAQAQPVTPGPVTTNTETTTTSPTEPSKVTTVVKGGGLAANIIEWLQVAFGTTIGAAILFAITKGLQWFGIELAQQQRAQLQAIVVNGLNSAAEKAKVQLRDSHSMDIEVKSQIVADAVDYTQRHAGETIKALGLDPNSGEAVEAIKARIETALNDPASPTPAVITPPTGQPTAVTVSVAPDVNGVAVQGNRV